MDEWVFARVKGIPSFMRWPVQILEEKPEGLVEVFCKANDAVVPSEEEGYLKVLQVWSAVGYRKCCGRFCEWWWCGHSGDKEESKNKHKKKTVKRWGRRAEKIFFNLFW